MLSAIFWILVHIYIFYNVKRYQRLYRAFIILNLRWKTLEINRLFYSVLIILLRVKRKGKSHQEG